MGGGELRDHYEQNFRTELLELSEQNFTSDILRTFGCFRPN